MGLSNFKEDQKTNYSKIKKFNLLFSEVFVPFSERKSGNAKKGHVAFKSVAVYCMKQYSINYIGDKMTISNNRHMPFDFIYSYYNIIRVCVLCDMLSAVCFEDFDWCGCCMRSIVIKIKNQSKYFKLI